MIRVAIASVGVLGPGLSDWASGQALLRDPGLWHNASTVVAAPSRLPATERRRAGNLVKASVLVADQALAGGAADPATLATVFTSSTGDPLNCHLLCETLATPERMVSPTRFTNSVHNAPAGYWHIATASRAASTSLAAHDASFAVGLLEAIMQCRSMGAPVLLVACDLPYPEPLNTVRPVTDVFAVALLITPDGGRGLHIEMTPGGEGSEASVCAHEGFEHIRSTIPAARALPLLQALAQVQAGHVVLDNLPGSTLHLHLDPA